MTILHKNITLQKCVQSTKITHYFLGGLIKNEIKKNSFNFVSIFPNDLPTPSDDLSATLSQVHLEGEN